MPPPDTNSLAAFLNYGGLGLLAILCLVVLGYNVWSLNALVSRADPKRITAAKPLLLTQMGVSLIGMLACGMGGIYLEGMKGEGERARKQMAQILVDPWDGSLDTAVMPAVKIGKEVIKDMPVNVLCTPDMPTTIKVDMGAFIRYKQGQAKKMQEVMLPLTAAMGGQP
jgi:hypothetical protein